MALGRRVGVRPALQGALDVGAPDGAGIAVADVLGVVLEDLAVCDLADVGADAALAAHVRDERVDSLRLFACT
jgi:hypothetical protein